MISGTGQNVENSSSGAALTGFLEIPSIAELLSGTASELSGAIQRYGALVIDKDISDQELNLKLDNFYDEAYIMIRMNEGTPGNIEGGELTHITGNLYLLRAKEKSVKIEIR